MSLHHKKTVTNRENRVATVSPARLAKHESKAKLGVKGGKSRASVDVHLNTHDSPSREKGGKQFIDKLDPIYRTAVEAVEDTRRSNDMLPKRKLKHNNPTQAGSAYVRQIKHKSSVGNLKGVRHTGGDDLTNGTEFSLPVAGLSKPKSSSVLLIEASKQIRHRGDGFTSSRERSGRGSDVVQHAYGLQQDVHERRVTKLSKPLSQKILKQDIGATLGFKQTASALQEQSLEKLKCYKRAYGKRRRPLHIPAGLNPLGQYNPYELGNCQEAVLAGDLGSGYDREMYYSSRVGDQQEYGSSRWITAQEALAHGVHNRSASTHLNQTPAPFHAEGDFEFPDLHPNI